MGLQNLMLAYLGRGGFLKHVLKVGVEVERVEQHVIVHLGQELRVWTVRHAPRQQRQGLVCQVTAREEGKTVGGHGKKEMLS